MKASNFVFSDIQVNLKLLIELLVFKLLFSVIFPISVNKNGVTSLPDIPRDFAFSMASDIALLMSFSEFEKSKISIYLLHLTYC